MKIPTIQVNEITFTKSTGGQHKSALKGQKYSIGVAQAFSHLKPIGFNLV